eukprot:g3044.t1
MRVVGPLRNVTNRSELKSSKRFRKRRKRKRKKSKTSILTTTEKEKENDIETCGEILSDAFLTCDSDCEIETSSCEVWNLKTDELRRVRPIHSPTFVQSPKKVSSPDNIALDEENAKVFSLAVRSAFSRAMLLKDSLIKEQVKTEDQRKLISNVTDYESSSTIDTYHDNGEEESAVEGDDEQGVIDAASQNHTTRTPISNVARSFADALASMQRITTTVTMEESPTTPVSFITRGNKNLTAKFAQVDSPMLEQGSRSPSPVNLLFTHPEISYDCNIISTKNQVKESESNPIFIEKFTLRNSQNAKRRRISALSRRREAAACMYPKGVVENHTEDKSDECGCRCF